MKYGKFYIKMTLLTWASFSFNGRQIVPKSEALEQIVSKKLVSRSIEVTEGQKSRK